MNLCNWFVLADGLWVATVSWAFVFIFLLCGLIFIVDIDLDLVIFIMLEVLHHPKSLGGLNIIDKQVKINLLYTFFSSQTRQMF